MRSAIPPAVLSLLVIGATLTAQQTPPVFRAETEAVLVTATIVDRAGRAVTDLRREELRLLEDNAPQEIAQFHTDAETPLSAVLVVDTSGSMVDKLDDVEDALRHFLGSARTDDELTMLHFSNFVDVVATADEGRDQLRRQIGRLVASGGTALYDAMVEGLDHARRGRHRKKALIVVTDGNDTSSTRDEDDAIDAVRRSEVLVYALGIGHGERGSFGHDLFSGRFGHPDEVDIRTLRRLAEPSGGRASVRARRGAPRRRRSD
ncbi:MAG TPA: VWA domain-containing protein [Vicinamibacterales bacterium]|nr:VWA domain-containing protein [Vicinamibacterales bacterium]